MSAMQEPVTTTTSMLSPVRLAYGLIPLLTLLERRGIDSESVLSVAGIPRFGLVDPRYTITFDQELAVYRAALVHLPYPHASLEVAGLYDFRSFSVLGLAMQSCNTLREMMGLIFSYPRLAWGTCDIVQIDTEESSTLQMVASPILGSSTPFLQERDIACALGFARTATGQDIRYREVRFAHQAPDDIQPYADFFKCPLRFDCEITEVISDRDQGDIAIPSASPMARAFFEAQCATMSDAMDVAFRYADAVRDRLLRVAPVPDLDALAADMAMTPRTLQRRLREEGTSFSHLLQEARLQRARDLLCRTKKTLDQIAAQLGFNDAVAFSHAFKSWTNCSPGTWRERHRADLAPGASSHA